VGFDSDDLRSRARDGFEQHAASLNSVHEIVPRGTPQTLLR
jgi:hypothetical protein